MKHSDFSIGLIFSTSVGYWKCTDIGTRTICAIPLDHENDPSWYNGPPYAVQEVVFDEYDLPACFTDLADAMNERMDTLVDRIHPGFDVDDILKMFREKRIKSTMKYPFRNILRKDRLGKHGEIFHPYAAVEVGDKTWSISVFEVFTRQFSTMPDDQFRDLPLVTPEDMIRRRDTIQNTQPGE